MADAAPFAPGTLVAVRRPDDVGGTIPAEEVEGALARGWRLESQDEENERLLEQKYGDATIKAGLEGFARSVSFGFSDVALKGLGLVEEEALRERRQRNQGVSLGTEVLGSLVSLPGTQGFAAAKAGKAVSVGLRGLSKSSSVLARTGARAAATAAEGVVFSLGQGVSNVALDPHPATAETVLAELGSSMLFGGVVGGAVGGGTSLASDLLRKGTSKLSRALGNKPALAEDSVSLAKKLGTTADDVEARAAKLEEKLDGAFATEGTKTAPATRTELSAADKAVAAEKVAKLTDNHVKGLLDDIANTKFLAGKFGRVPAVTEAAKKFDDVAEALKRVEAAQTEFKTLGLESLTKRIREKKLPRMREILANEPHRLRVAVQELEASALDLGRIAQARGVALKGELAAGAKAFKDIGERDILSTLDNWGLPKGTPVASAPVPGVAPGVVATEAAPGGVLGFMKSLDKTDAALLAASWGLPDGSTPKQLAEAALIFRNRGGTGSIAGKIGGRVLGAATRVFPGGGVLGGIARDIVGDTVGTKLGGVGRKAFEASHKVAQKLVGRVDSFLAEGAPTVRRAATAAILRGARFNEATQRTPPGASDTQRLYLKRAGELQTAMLRPQDTEARLKTRLGPLASEHPQLADQVAKSAMQQMRTLAKALPKSKRPSVLEPDLVSDYVPSDAEIEQFATAVKFSQDPSAVFDEMDDGTLTPQAAATWKRLWPELYLTVREEITLKVAENRKNVPYDKIVQYSLFLGEPLHSTMRPEFLQTISAMYGSEPETQGGTEPPPAKFGSVKPLEPTLAQRVSMKR